MLTTAVSELFFPPHKYQASISYEGEQVEWTYCSIAAVASPFHYRLFRAAYEVFNIGLNSKALILAGCAGFWLKRRTAYGVLVGGSLGLLASCVYRASRYLFERTPLKRALEIHAGQICTQETILQDMKFLYHLRNEGIQNPSTNKWFALVEKCHEGQKNVLKALINDYLEDNSTGLTCALLLSAKNLGRGPGPALLHGIDRVVVVWFQFKAILASPDCLLFGKTTSQETRTAFMKQHEEELNWIRQESKQALTNLDSGILLHKNSFYFRIKQPAQDLRKHLSRNEFIQSLESSVAEIETEIPLALICARVVFYNGNRGHAVFVQFNGNHYRFWCSMEGLFSFHSRAEMLDGLFKFMRNINSPIKAIEIYFYTM